MIRAIVQYEAEPDAQRYASHIEEFVTKVDCSAFRHGRIFGSPFGEPDARYYAEFEWADMESFKAAANSEPFAATGEGCDGDGHPLHRSLRFDRVSRADTPPPGRPGRARLRGDRLREGAAARDDPAQPARRPQRVRLPHAARDRARVRGRVVGRRRARPRRHRHRSRVLRRRRPAHWDETLVGRPQEYWKWFGAFKDMHDRLRELGKPTIARVNGIAVGGGNELQMACDLSVMVDDAFIRHVGLEHGSVPAGGATQWLQLMVGDRRAREIVLLCEEIPAVQAAEWGLVNRAVPAAELDAVVDGWVEKPRSQAAADDPLCEASAELCGATSPGTRPSGTPATGSRSRCWARRRRARSGRSWSGQGMNVDEMLKGARDAMAVKRVYGDPIERDGVLVIPAAAVRGGGGGGGDERQNGGGGFGLQARPVGAYVIRDGEVEWEPAVDVSRIALAGLGALVLCAFLLRSRK